jgi:hypothetical protein
MKSLRGTPTLRFVSAASQRAARERIVRKRRRVRSIAFAIMALGVIVAGYVYWLGIHPAQPSLEDLLPGSKRLTQRQVGLLYGHSGQIVYEWMQDARRPEVKALIILLGAAISAYLYVRLSGSDAHESA